MSGHDEGPGGGAVIPLQVLQVAEEQSVYCGAVHREEKAEKNIRMRGKECLFLPRYDVASNYDDNDRHRLVVEVEFYLDTGGV